MGKGVSAPTAAAAGGQIVMKPWIAALVLALIFVTAAYAVDPTQMPTPELQKR